MIRFDTNIAGFEFLSLRMPGRTRNVPVDNWCLSFHSKLNLLGPVQRNDLHDVLSSAAQPPAILDIAFIARLIIQLNVDEQEIFVALVNKVVGKGERVCIRAGRCAVRAVDREHVVPEP
jgi:hypothetical protein